MNQYRHFTFLIVLLSGLAGFCSSARAAQINWNPWWTYTNTETTFSREDRDVASFDRAGDLDYIGPTYLQEQEQYTDTGSTSSELSRESDLAGIPASEQSDAASYSELSSIQGNPIEMGIDLNVSGTSRHNETSPPPLHGAGSTLPDPNPPTNPDDFAYYNNWDYTTAESYAYGGFGGTGNIFAIDDGDDIYGEEILMTGTFSFGYSLSGTWSYQTLIEDGFDPFDERTGYFWTGFNTFFTVYDGAGNSDGSNSLLTTSPAFSTELSRDDAIDTSAVSETFIHQSKSGTGAFDFSFRATEGTDYEFLFFADLYGRADGIADFNSSAWASVDFGAAGEPVPEPGTLVLFAIGGAGLVFFRRRFSRQTSL